MDCYIIVIYFGTFSMQKLELLACTVHFRGRSCFGDLESKKFQSLFEALNNCLLDQIFLINIINLLMLFYTSRTFQQYENHLNESSSQKVTSPTS